MQQDERKLGIIRTSDIDIYIFVAVYFILVLEYDLYNFFGFGSIMPSSVLTVIEIVLLLFVVLTIRSRVSVHYLVYIFLLMGIGGTYIFAPKCRDILQMLFFTGSSFKKVFLLPLAAHCIKDPKKFGDKLYTLSIAAGYIHVICNTVWGYSYTDWGEFNYMVYGMALVTPACLVMCRMFKSPSKFNIITVLLFELNIIIYGHRGALFVSIVMIFILFIKYVKVPRKMLIGTIGVVGFITLLIFKEQIIQAAIDLMKSMGLQSRTLEKLLSGDITNDSERNTIWAYMVKGIFENIPFGKGIGADRLILESTMREGLYAHNFVLEICLNYGIVIGTIIVGWIIKMVYNCLTKIHDDDWYQIIIPFLIPSLLTLLTSASIYQYWLFWLSIGFYYCYFGREIGRKIKN